MNTENTGSFAPVLVEYYDGTSLVEMKYVGEDENRQKKYPRDYTSCLLTEKYFHRVVDNPNHRPVLNITKALLCIPLDATKIALGLVSGVVVVFVGVGI